MTQLLSLITPDTIVNEPEIIETGDCGIVLKADGTFRVFTSGMNDVTARNLTDEQRSTAERLLALTVALKTPQIMDMLLGIVNDPAVVNQSAIVDCGVKH